jgi:hypothetical protein
VLQYDLDGIDVDLEGSDLDENYENFALFYLKASRRRPGLL